MNNSSVYIFVMALDNTSGKSYSKCNLVHLGRQKLTIAQLITKNNIIKLHLHVHNCPAYYSSASLC